MSMQSSSWKTEVSGQREIPDLNITTAMDDRDSWREAMLKQKDDDGHQYIYQRPKTEMERHEEDSRM